MRLKNKLVRKERENVKKLKRAAKRTNNYNKSMGIVKLPRKDLNIPAKAPFAKKLIDEYQSQEERKRAKNNDLLGNMTAPTT